MIKSFLALNILINFQLFMNLTKNTGYFGKNLIILKKNEIFEGVRLQLLWLSYANILLND